MKDVYTTTDDEYRALRAGCGLVDYTGLGQFRVSGRRAAATVSSAVTRSVDFLLEGQIMPALALAEDGTVVSDILVHCLGGNAYTIEAAIGQRDALAGHLEATVFGQPDIAVDDLSDSVVLLGIEGPQAPRIAQAFLPFSIASMAYRSFAPGTSGAGVAVVISRTGVTGEYGYKLEVPAEQAAAVRAELLSAGVVECGRLALNICRVEMRFVDLEVESTGLSQTPFELGMQWMVDLHHDFFGKAALNEHWQAKPRQLPVCWGAEDPSPAACEDVNAVLIDGHRVGQVTASVFSPTLGRLIGVAQVDRDLAASGIYFTLGSGRAVRTVSAPFLVPSSFGIPLE